MARKKSSATAADKPFDAIGKQLIAAHPADWLALIGVTDTGAVPLELVDGDLATIVPQADRVLLRGGTVPELFNIELETGHHGNLLPERLLFYSVALTQKYKLPVRSAVFLLRREADSPALTGLFERPYANGAIYLRFEYQVVRVWQLPVESLLVGGIATLPLAPVADVALKDLPAVIARLKERFGNESPELEREYWLSTYYLLGTKYPADTVNNLLKGIGTMFESTTYNETIEKGRAQGLTQGLTQGITRGIEEGEKRSLLLLGTERFGEPTAEVRARIESQSNALRVTTLLKRVLRVSSWEELIAE
jgi:predicted transposase YdaD